VGGESDTGLPGDGTYNNWREVFRERLLLGLLRKANRLGLLTEHLLGLLAAVGKNGLGLPAHITVKRRTRDWVRHWPGNKRRTRVGCRGGERGKHSTTWYRHGNGDAGTIKNGRGRAGE